MEIFSPTQQVTYKGFSFYIKRDDLIDPYISGNKWRKLKWILTDVKITGKTHLVTFGGAYSNHLVATAAAAARNGLKATSFVRGEKVSNEILLLCQLFGMQLIFVDREVYKDKLELYHTVFKGDPTTYFIDEGGACELAVKGCAETIEELDSDFDAIFCAAGTGTTAAGLLRGMNHHNSSSSLEIVSVLKGGSFLKDEIAIYEPDTRRLNLHLDYHFGGYAKTTPKLLSFIKEFTKATGILIDPIYTGKMCFALYDLYQKKYFKPRAKILAFHTGGLLGIWGKKEKFAEILT